MDRMEAFVKTLSANAAAGLVRKDVILLSIMIVNELTVFASLTVRFLRGVCQVLRSAQRLPALHALFLCQVLFC